MQLLDRAKLVRKLEMESLIHKHSEEYFSTNEPVLWLAVRAHKSAAVFFKKVAHLLHLQYVTTIPLKISERASVVEKLGLPTAVKYLCFPYLQDDTLIIVVSDPYRADEIEAACSSVVTTKKIEWRLAAPQVIWGALNHSLYEPVQLLAENTLHSSFPDYSSKKISPHIFYMVILSSIVVLVAALLAMPVTVCTAFIVVINIFYALLNPVKTGLALGIFLRKKTPLTVNTTEFSYDHLPMYTILVPLKDEVESIPRLLKSLSALEYPKEKLDVKFAVEVTDTATLAALAAAGVSVHENDPKAAYSLYQVVKIPVSPLSTKPRSCNYALQFARGSLVVIYDAEDQPDPLQLYKAYQVFLDSKLNTICVQAKLNYYNPHQNILTRCFTAEYTFWFDILLPSLQYWNIPLPLGGTSNHFQTNALQTIGTWDAYNVTEDAELGWRLARLGYRTAMLDSYTMEEANSQTWNWIRQRTRWQKGFLLTLLVHLQKPVALVRDLGLKAALLSVLIFSTTVFLPLINLWLWIYSLIWLYVYFTGTETFFLALPTWLHLMSVSNLILGNLIYIAMHGLGLIYMKRWSLLWILPLMPAYWVLQAISSYRSLWQIGTQPFVWEKTQHNLYQPTQSRKNLSH
jgi:cellulose synthase/poly-beta-1,6-N-acetylglucosamine synthase-like glycosyltransferase